jgi:nucleoside-diphosphate-sugar epimerase
VKVLLTGATGFIGSHVARALVAQGAEIHALVLPQDSFWRIADVAPRLRFHTANFLDVASVARVSEAVRPELCIHLAWYVEPGKYLEAPENRDFLHASIVFARTLARIGCRRFVATGTCFEYDTDRGVLSESSPTRPRTLYASCKLQLFQQLEQVGQETGMEIGWLRFFYQYGPFEDPRRLVPYVIGGVLRGELVKLTPGEQVRDYLHVEDVAGAVCAIVRSNLTGPVNIGSGQPVTVREIALRIGELLGRADLIALGAQPYIPGDPMRIVADNKRLRDGAGWKARFNLDEGLRQTIEWWKIGAYPKS